MIKDLCERNKLKKIYETLKSLHELIKNERNREIVKIIQKLRNGIWFKVRSVVIKRRESFQREIKLDSHSDLFTAVKVLENQGYEILKYWRNPLI